MAKAIRQKVKLICMECGTRFTRTVLHDVECPKCKGVDVDLDIVLD